MPYPWASGSSIFALALCLFPKQVSSFYQALDTQHLIPGLWMPQHKTVCDSHSRPVWCFTDQNPWSPLANAAPQILGSWPWQNCLSWSRVWSTRGGLGPSGTPPAGAVGDLLLSVPRHHMTSSAHSFLGSPLGNRGSEAPQGRGRVPLRRLTGTQPSLSRCQVPEVPPSSSSSSTHTRGSSTGSMPRWIPKPQQGHSSG